MKNIVYWILAVMLTLAAVIYQRKTGPTYPQKVTYELDGQEMHTKLPRSSDGLFDLPVLVPVPHEGIRGMLHYKRLGVKEAFQELPMNYQDGNLVASLPAQPAAGKLLYYISFQENDVTEIYLQKSNPVLIRFKDEVPLYFLLPHVLAMFIAMLLSNFLGILCVANDNRYKKYTSLSLLFLLLGGMFFGPIVQKYAFGAFWTGIPFGWDLTDNKTLIAVLFFIFAWFYNRKGNKMWWSLIAVLVLLVIYSIPHSVMGSSFNYETGKVVTGMLMY